MTLPVAKIDVINQALLELGRLPVIQETDSKDAQVIGTKLDILLPVLLASTTWNFAIKFVYNNTPTTQVLSPDFVFNYVLPFDFGRFFKFSTNTFPLYYEILDNLLLVNVKPVQYYYVVNNVDYEVITALFYRALAIYAAADTCIRKSAN